MQGSEIQYEINKGVNRAIEFRGLKAQYIYYLAVGLAVLLLLFCVLYISGIPIYLDLALILSLGGGLFIVVAKMSRKYGQHGLKKQMAAKKLPWAIRPGRPSQPASLQLFRLLTS
jgi:hypothetical protein